MYKIKIISILSVNIHAQYIGQYLGDEKQKVTCNLIYGGGTSLTLNPNDKIKVDMLAVTHAPLQLDEICIFDGVLRIVAQNPKEGIVINVTKIYITPIKT